MNYQRTDLYEEMAAYFFDDYAPSKMEELVDLVNRRKCKVEGHKLHDDSFGGPEGGYIAVTCERCGWHSHTRLY